MCIFVLMICSCIVNKYSLFIQTTHVRMDGYALVDFIQMVCYATEDIDNYPSADPV